MLGCLLVRFQLLGEPLGLVDELLLRSLFRSRLVHNTATEAHSCEDCGDLVAWFASHSVMGSRALEFLQEEGTMCEHTLQRAQYLLTPVIKSSMKQ